jgi:hypothetical protein
VIWLVRCLFVFKQIAAGIAEAMTTRTYREGKTLAATVVTTMFLILLIVPAHADFQSGLKAYENGDYKTALKEWLVEAEAGEPVTQRNVGHMYRKGQGVAKDFGAALKWYRRSAEQGFARAQANLGNMYLRGQGTNKDAKEAAKWFFEAAKQNHAIAQYNLGLLFESGVGVAKSDVEALRWFYEASRQGHRKSLEKLSQLIARGVPAPTSESSTVVRLHSSEKGLSVLQSLTLCTIATATNYEQGVQWDPSFLGHVEEAKRRNLSLRECARITGKEYKGNLEKAREERKQKQKDDAGRKKHEAEADLIVEQEQVKKTEAAHKQALATERRSQIAKARTKNLDLLKKKNKHSVAVIIGNKNYKGRTPAVDFAHNDADAMRKFVLERLAYRDGNIIDLRDAGRNRIEAVFGNERTPEGELFSIIREGKSDVIVYYSGHGVPGLKDKRPYLLPVNGDPNLAEITGYPVDTLYKNLAKLPARSVTVFLDACFSGDSDKGMLISSASGLSLEPELPSATGRLTVITAAQGNQLASWDPKARHGLFTKHLLDALNGKADDEEYGNADGKVSLSEVQTYLDDEMTYQARRTWNRRQNAYVRGSGNLVLASVLSLPGSVSDTADIEEMDATYTVLKAANLRAGPSTDTAVVGKLKVNTSVNVTGKVSGRNWYRLNDGSYVFGSLISVGE